MSLLQKIKGKLGIKHTAKSETSKVRPLVIKFCNGIGADVGFGGDKIKNSAAGIDFPQPYTRVGRDEVNIPSDLSQGPVPVPDSYFDYVYSSHLIEDFEDTAKILMEFIRILSRGGNLILVFPDQVAYAAYCYVRKQRTNPHHIHPDMGLSFMLKVIKKLPIEYEFKYISDCNIDYNVIIVIKLLNK